MKGIILKQDEVRTLQSEGKVTVWRDVKTKKTRKPFTGGMLGYAHVKDHLTTGLKNGAVKCPYAMPDEMLFVRETLWVSECGEWYAYGFRPSESDVFNEAFRYTWNGSLGQYPESRYCIGSWSNDARNRKGITKFSVSLLDCDQSVKIIVGTGNAVIGRKVVVFSKKKPSTTMPEWASRYTVQCSAVTVEKHGDMWQWGISLEKVTA